ncbi:MAG: S1C family serine protease [Holosporales bacterium]|nr:S1C family serine protease [Holosporales bacterium]
MRTKILLIVLSAGAVCYHHNVDAVAVQQAEDSNAKPEKRESLPSAKSGCKKYDESSQKRQNDGLSQKQLLDRIRRGVVAITVTAHEILEKYVNSKLWHGTGFLVDLGKGLIITNAHVAGEMSVCTYEVKFGNGQTAEATLAYCDPCYDFAVLRVKPSDIPAYCCPLVFSKIEPTINTTVYAMGNSSRKEFSTYTGFIFDNECVLSLKSVAEQSFQFSGLTVPGASGSPVLDEHGDVIGLLYGGKMISGAALPISYIKHVIDALKEGETRRRYFYGFIIRYMPIQEAIIAGLLSKEAADEYEKHFPRANNKVLYVLKKLTAFESEELLPGDIIWKVEGELIGPNLKRIDEIVQNKKGKPLSMTIYREGKKKKITQKTFELSSAANMKLLSFAGTLFFGTTTDMLIEFGKTAQAVYIVESEAGSPFSDVTSPDDGSANGGAYQIVSINRRHITTLEDVIAAIRELLESKIAVFEITYKRIFGDEAEHKVLAKFAPEFARATLYKYDIEKMRWAVEAIQNPQQAGG